jgi:two-component system invasion response regulator UvrY
MPDSQPRILLADDHSVIRTGLKYLLARNFPMPEVQEVESCGDLMETLGEKDFSHLILDLQLGDCNSLEVLPGILREYPRMYVLIYTMSSEEIFGRRLIQMGAHGFLSKEAEEKTVVKALRRFLIQGSYLGEHLSAQLNDEQEFPEPSNNPFDQLSDREMTVLLYLLKGHRVKEISNKLDLGISTIATYKVRLFEKLGVNNLADMHRLADIYHIG